MWPNENPLNLIFNDEALTTHEMTVSRQPMFKKLKDGMYRFALNYYLEADDTNKDGFRINVIIRKPFQFDEDDPKPIKVGGEKNEPIEYFMDITKDALDQLNIEIADEYY